jgi:hypothetical protein
LLAHGRWFSPGTPASSTTKTGCHDIAEILLKVVLNTKNQIIHPSIIWFLLDNLISGARPCVEKMQLNFFVPPNEELEIAPPKMKVKGYMYPQMKKPVGMLQIMLPILKSPTDLPLP